MSNCQYDAVRLQAELAQVRAALGAVEAPAADEANLRAQFREAARHRARKAAPPSRHDRRRLRLPLAAAAVVVLGVGAAITAVVQLVETSAPMTQGADAPPAEPRAVSVFQPLLNSPGLSPSSAYSVVRVRIPLSAFAVVPGTQHDGSIEADLLVGEDGLARGIRFNEADALLVSVAGQ
jgi:hypothetical protein